MGPEDWLSLQYWGCQNPVYELCMQKPLIADRVYNAWKKMPEQSGSSMWFRLNFTRSNMTCFWFESIMLTFISPEEPSCPATPEYLWWDAFVLILYSNTCFYPWRQPMHFLKNLCSQVHTISSQNVWSWRHFQSIKLKCFWWGLKAHQSSRFLLKA